VDGQTSGHEVHEARRLLGELGVIQGRTRADFLDGTWQWMAVWAVVCAGAAASAFSPLAGWYWMLGAPLGMAVTMAVSVRAESRVRLRRKAWPSVATGVGIGIVIGLISWRFEESVIVVAVWVVLGLGFAVLTAIDRVASAPTVFVMLSIGSTVTGVAVRDPYALYPWLAGGFSLALAYFAARAWRGVPE